MKHPHDTPQPRPRSAFAKAKSIAYRVVLYRQGSDVETLYWAGSLSETLLLARTLAIELDADAYRIVEFVAGDSEVYSETWPFGAV